MTWSRGQSGNALGRRTVSEKPFNDALRLEIAAAGDDHRALRSIARNLIELAQRKTFEAMPAINAIADRLDGKPSQESVVNVVKRDASDWTRDELVAFLQDARREVEANEPKLIEAKPVEEKS
jgi:hypothetical protein